MRVAIYSRKSVETDTGESIKNQIKFCKEYFERHENCTFEIFEDEGFSGGNTNRPSFQRMMELVKIKQFDVVAVYKIDRIARNIVDFVNVYDELDKVDVKLVSITEGFDPSTPAGKVMMLILASFAEMERMNIAQRVKDNMKELAKMGRWSGGTPPTGYTTKKVVENGKRVTYLELTEESVYIKEIFEEYFKGYSTYEISKSFKNKGLNYPQKTIQNILTNPTYLISTKESVKYLESQGYSVYGEPNGCGFLPYNRRPRTKGIKSWNDKSKFVGVSRHQAIIDLGLWLKVQEKLEEKTVDPHPVESSFTFLSGGIVKCKCGGSMFVSPGKVKKDGTRVYYFRCLNKKNGITECDNKFLRVDITEQALHDFLIQFLDKQCLIKYVDNGSSKNIDGELKAVNKKITVNTKSIDNLVNKLMLLSNDDVALVITKKIEELTNLNNSLREHSLKLERERLLNDLGDKNIDILYDQIKKFLSSDDLEAKRICVKTIVKQIIWDSSTGVLQVELLK